MPIRRALDYIAQDPVTVAMFDGVGPGARSSELAAYICRESHLQWRVNDQYRGIQKVPAVVQKAPGRVMGKLALPANYKKSRFKDRIAVESGSH